MADGGGEVNMQEPASDSDVLREFRYRWPGEEHLAPLYEPNVEERVEEPHLEEHVSDIQKESDEVHEEVQNQRKIDQSDEEDEYEAILRDSDYEQSDVEINEKSEDYQLGEQSENEDGDYIVHPGEEESDYGNSELLESGEDSSTESGDMDDEGGQNQGNSVNKRSKPKIILPKFRLLNKDRDLGDPKFELGLHFADVKQVRSAVVEYSHKNGRNLKLRPNDQRRVRAMCMGVTTKRCPFYFYASLKNRKNEDKTFVVKKWNPKHTCCRTTKNRFATSAWLAKRFSDLIIGNPCITTKDFTKHVLKDYRIDITRWQVYCAKKIALKQNTGAMEAQYASLHDYAMELLDRNPGSTIIIKKTGEEPNIKFQRIYICFNALKQGFKDGCRRMVGLDGCHLKGRSKGQLLTAVGIDANNGMFPVAYAVVEIEDTDSWTWFMELFIDDVAIMNERLGWVIISDKQKGLKNCINSLLPEVEHRFCVRHLHENFKLDGHVGNLLKQQLWTIARTTTQPWFRKEMKVMQKMSTPAHDWLVVRPATQWSRSHFQTHSKCDIMLNNLCEAFNKALLSARKLSIISMLEEIRVYLMLRMSKKRGVEWNQVVGPRIMGILEKNQLAATECSSLYAGNMTYEVQSSSQRTFAVDLGKKTCSCRRWELCGLPCPHAISAMTGVDFVERSHAWYKRDKYDAAYAKHISPMPDWTQWKRHDQPTLNAPDIKAQQSRRKLKRKLGMDETRRNAQTLKKLFSQMRCTKCGEIGHNTRTCGQIPEVERQARARFIMENRVKTGVEPPAPLQPRTTRTRRSASQASNSHPPQPSPPRVPLASSQPNAKSHVGRPQPRTRVPARPQPRGKDRATEKANQVGKDLQMGSFMTTIFIPPRQAPSLAKEGGSSKKKKLWKL